MYIHECESIKKYFIIIIIIISFSLYLIDMDLMHVSLICYSNDIIPKLFWIVYKKIVRIRYST